jgi:hypothetical protein
MNIRLHIKNEHKSSPKTVNSQVMTTVKDPILTAWESDVRQQPRSPAIFDSWGKSRAHILEIETRPDQICGRVGRIAPGQVLAIKSGNHPDGHHCSGLLAKTDRRSTTEQTISDEQRQNAFRLCQVAAPQLCHPSGKC